MNCYVCDIEITADNKTDEHILINASGGRLKSKKLICSKCNSYFGKTIDTNLAKQLNNFANLFMVKRHRGNPQPIIGEMQSTGEKYQIKFGNKFNLTKPTIVKTVNGDKANFSIKVSSKKEIRKILTNIAKEYPNLDVEGTMKSIQLQEEPFAANLDLQITIGGSEVFSAICKSATNYYIYCNGDPSQIKHLIPYIKGEEQKEIEKEIVWFHYQDNLYELKPDECSHILHLVGNKQERILYCYVDYFNTHKYLVLLNDSYQGQDIKQTYFFDLVNVVPIQREVTIEYDRKTLLEFFTNKDAKPFEKLQKSTEHFLSLCLKRQDEHLKGEIVYRAMQNKFGKNPETMLWKDITPEMIEDIVNESMKNITLYYQKRNEEIKIIKTI